MAKIGVTGTRKGASNAQLMHLHDELVRVGRLTGTLVHGDCVGVDFQADYLWRDIWPVSKVEIFPADVDTYRAHCAQTGDIVHEPLPYLQRNRLIVDSVQHLLVIPDGSEHDNPRSGTWMAYRYAVRRKVPFTVIRADRW